MAPWNIPFRRNRSQDPARRGPGAGAARDADPPHAGLAGIASTFMYRDLVNPSNSSESPFVAQARNLHDGGHRDFEGDERTGRSTHRREPTHSPQTPPRPVPYSNADALAALDPEGEHLGVLPSASSTSSFGDWGRSPRNENGLHPLAPASHRQLWPNASSPSLPISQNPPQLPPLDPAVRFAAHPWEIERHYGLPLRPLTQNSRSVERLVPAPGDLAYRPPPPPATFSLQRPPRSRSESPAVFNSQERRRA